MEKIVSKRDLYLEFIRDIYHAEILLIPELRFFIEKVSSDSLKAVINNHLSNTHSHTSKLEEIQENLHSDIMQEHCRTMKSMILETKDLVERCSTDKLVERGIVASLHRITNCQIVVYQMLVSIADELGLETHTQILQKLLNDEIAFDKKVSAYGFSTLWQEFDIMKKLS